MTKIKITSDFLNKHNQVQLRLYKPNGKYLEPLKQWYHIGDEWGLKIKKGHYKMIEPTPFEKFLNKKLDELDAKKIPYEMMFFDGTIHYKSIHNVPTDGWDYNFTKFIPRKIDTFVD